MNMGKNLLLVSAASLIVAGGAQAADLPVKAKAIEYVKICSLYGAGFYYIPGTDTCIKLGGYLRVETALNTNGVYASGRVNGAAGANNRLSNYYTSRSRQGLTIDTRTATEYGVVRTFFEGKFDWTSGGYTATGAGGTAYAGDFVAGGSLGVYNAFIQFAGFTLGRANSQFSTPWANYPGNNFDGLPGSGGYEWVNQFAYTAEFG
ncbi:porin, partial [Bradyrhizobium murdochi]|uniref:porin n=1 Tax=Bradyrhizobium murdochi TaxID=1038859 RepID=UPI0004911FAB